MLIHCQYCHKKFLLSHSVCDKLKKSYINYRRIKIGGLTVCDSCYGLYKRNGTFERRKVEMLTDCQYCKKKFVIRISTNDKLKKSFLYYRRLNVDGLKVCNACYQRYKLRGTFERKKFLTKEEKRELKRNIYQISKSRNKYYKSLPVDSLWEKLDITFNDSDALDEYGNRIFSKDNLATEGEK